MKNRLNLWVFFLAAFTGVSITASTASQQLWNIVDVVQYAKAKSSTSVQPPISNQAKPLVPVPHDTITLIKGDTLTYLAFQPNFSTQYGLDFSILPMKDLFGDNLLPAINAALAKGKTIGLTATVTANTLGGYQASITAVDVATQKSLGTKVSFPVIVQNTGTTPENFASSYDFGAPFWSNYDGLFEPLNHMNVVYQRSSDGSLQAILTISTTNPSTVFIKSEAPVKTPAKKQTVQSPAPVIKSLKDLSLSQLQKKITLNTSTPATGTIPVSSGVPTGSLNINFGSSAGFSLYGDAWDLGLIGDTSISTVQNISLLTFTNSQWSSGVTFLMLAADSNGIFIPKITKKNTPAQFYLFAYDSNGNLLKSLPVALNQASASPDFNGVWSSKANSLQIGGANSLLTATYPAAFTLMSQTQQDNEDNNNDNNSGSYHI